MSASAPGVRLQLPFEGDHREPLAGNRRRLAFAHPFRHGVAAGEPEQEAEAEQGASRDPRRCGAPHSDVLPAGRAVRIGVIPVGRLGIARQCRLQVTAEAQQQLHRPLALAERRCRVAYELGKEPARRLLVAGPHLGDG